VTCDSDADHQSRLTVLFGDAEEVELIMAYARLDLPFFKFLPDALEHAEAVLFGADDVPYSFA